MECIGIQRSLGSCKKIPRKSWTVGEQKGQKSKMESDFTSTKAQPFPEQFGGACSGSV